MTEAELQKNVMDTARFYGWLAAHFRPAQTKSGNWVTAMSGNTGFPDLVLVRSPQVIFAELKTDKGKLTDAQEIWASQLLSCEIAQSVVLSETNHRPAIAHYIWRPQDWLSGMIQAALRR